MSVRREEPVASGAYEDREFAELVADISSAIEAGRSVNWQELINEFPQFATGLNQVRPALESLRAFGEFDIVTSEEQSKRRPSRFFSEQTLGDFQIIREIGRGGMGTVFEAEQISMGRRVALKVLPFAALAHEKSLQRFRNEVRAAAALDHPHIVSVYSVGEQRGVHYFSMQFIRGQTLADLIHKWRNERDASEPHAAHGDILETTALSHGQDSSSPELSSAPPPATKRDEQAHISTAVDSRHTVKRCELAARLGIQAAEALQHAHEQGVLHRDVKPGNLLLDADRKLYVSDFGLARIQTDAGMTMTGDIVGTLRYMAPEQALAKRAVIDHRADVYSLGATLYELLTLEPAFGDSDRSELLRQLAVVEPKPPRKLDRQIPAELETIVLKAMAKEPDERYQTAQQLADDLRAFLEHRPIKAKPPTLVDRAAKWSRRHRSVVRGSAAVLSLVLVGLVIVSAKLANAAQTATREKDEALKNLYRANVQIAHSEWAKGRVDRTLQQLDQVRPRPGDEDLRRWEWYYTRSLCEHGTLIDGYLIKSSPDQPSRLVLREEQNLTTLFDRETGEVTLSTAEDVGGDYPAEIRLSHQGRRLTYIVGPRGGKSNELVVYDLESRQVLWRKSATPTVHVLDVSPDGKQIVTSRLRGDFTVWNAEDGSQLRTLQGSADFGWVGAVRWSADGRHIAACEGHGSIAVWTAATGELVRRWKSEANPGTSPRWGAIDVDSRGERIAIAGQNVLQVWNIKGDAPPLQIAAAHRGLISDVAFAPDGESIASCGLADNFVRVWDAVTGKLEHEFRGHTAMIGSVEWLDHGQRLASKSDYGKTKIWQLDDDQQYVHLPASGAIAWTPTGKLLAQGHREQFRGILFFDLMGPRPPQPVGSDSKGDVLCMDVDSAGRRLATGHEDGTLRLWDLSTRKMLRDVEVYTNHLGCISWSPDGSMIATVGGGREDGISVINSQTGEQICRRHVDDDYKLVQSAAWSPDGTRLVGVRSRDVKMWRTDNWKEVHHFQTDDGGNAVVQAVAWSPTGDRFACCTGEIVNVWNATTGRPLLRIRAHYRETNSIAWSPDGSRLATGGDDHTIKLWNAETGDDMLTLEGHENIVSYLCWSPDGRKLASSDGTKVLVWDAARGYLSK